MNIQRRKKLEALVDQLDELRAAVKAIEAEEDEILSRTPDNLRGSQQYKDTEQNSEDLNDAGFLIDRAIDKIMEAIERR